MELKRSPYLLFRASRADELKGRRWKTRKGIGGDKVKKDSPVMDYIE